MSQDQKNLKIVSLVSVVDALVCLVLGIVGIATQGLTGAGSLFGIALDAGQAALLVGVLLVALAVVELVAAARGIAAANTPRKVGAFRPLAVATVVVSVVAATLALVSQEHPNVLVGLVVAVALVLALVGVVLAGRIQAREDR